MKPKTAIVLIVMLLAVIVLVAIRQLGWFEPPAPPEGPNLTRMWREFPEEPQTIVIEADTGVNLRLELRDGAWRLVEPVEARAKEQKARELLTAFSKLEFERTYAADDSEAPDADLTGLDEPQWTLRVSDENDQRVLHVGRAVPLTNQRQFYARTDRSDAVYVIGDELVRQLRQPVEDWRDATLWNLPRPRIAKISVAGRRPFELTRMPDGWRLTAPVDAPADEQQAAQIVEALSQLEANGFPTMIDRAAAGLAPGDERLVATVWVERPRVTTAATEPAGPQLDMHRLALGNVTGDQVYAMADDVPGFFMLDKAILDTLQPEMNALREASLLAFEPDNVHRVRIRYLGEHIELQRADAGWRILRPVEGPAGDAVVERMLSDLADLQATDWREGPAASALIDDEPQGTVTLDPAGQDDPLTLEIGPTNPDGETTFVRRPGANGVALVETAALDELLTRNEEDYYSRVIFEMPKGYTAQRIEMRGSDGRVTLVRGEVGWTLAEPNTPADRQTVNELLDRMERLQATEVVAVGEAPQMTPDDERIRVELTATATVVDPNAEVIAQGVEAHPATRPTTAPGVQKQSWTLQFLRRGEQVLGWREDVTPVAVGEFAPELWDVLTVDFAAAMPRTQPVAETPR